MPTEKRINYLLNKCLQQTISDAEHEELNHYLLNPALKELVEDSLLQAFYTEKHTEEMPSAIKEQIISAISASADKVKPIAKKVIWLKWASVAAVCLFIIMPLLVKKDFRDIVFHLNFFADKKQDKVELKSELVEIGPAKESAILEMTDGTKLYIPSLPIGEEFSKSGLVVQKSSDNELLLKYDANLKSEAIAKQHIIRTAKGGRYNLTLPDGTKVQLNSDSKLTLPYSFTDSSRVVELEGEAFFDVVKDKRVFSVVSKNRSNSQVVSVYGTSFNISAYVNDPYFETTLVTGSVNVKNAKDDLIWLRPNESVVLNNLSFSKSVANLDRNLAWLNNIFYFEDESLDNVIKQIGRWYDVDFKNIPQSNNQHLWAQVSRNLNLRELLSIIEKTNDIKFKVIGKEVYIVN